jgi:hypothetical protein
LCGSLPGPGNDAWGQADDVAPIQLGDGPDFGTRKAEDDVVAELSQDERDDTSDDPTTGGTSVESEGDT